MQPFHVATSWLWLAVVACTHSAPPATTPAVAFVSRAEPTAAPGAAPPQKLPTNNDKDADPQELRAAYLAKIAAQFQPGWRQFLSDCRLRLPANHALNRMTLATTVDLTIDRAGHVVAIKISAPSGNADFDRAARDVIADPSPLAAPPVELLSDDDRLHLRWLFARDLRRAGPATAAILNIELPLAEVVARLIESDDLTRAARRIAIAPPNTERDKATTRVMQATLRQALQGLDGSVRRAAVEAISQAHAVELTSEVRGLLTITSDADLRIAAIAAAAELNDAEAVPAILVQLRNNLADNPQLALAATRALVRLGRSNDAAIIIRRALVGDRPNPIALEAFAVAPSPGIEGKLDRWYARGTPRIRAAACSALAGIAPARASRKIRRGFSDRDATVRAACAATAVHLAAASPGLADILADWLRPLVVDRDRGVRERAIEAIVTLDPSHRLDATSDPAPEVRAAYARALATSHPDLRALVTDRDPEVRAAAWTALTAKRTGAPDMSQLAREAVTDASPQVRFAAVHSLDDAEVLARIAQTDDAPQVRTAGLVNLAAKRGRADIAQFLLGRFASAAPGSAERVRVALAWLLAK